MHVVAGEILHERIVAHSQSHALLTLGIAWQLGCYVNMYGYVQK